MQRLLALFSTRRLGLWHGLAVVWHGLVLAWWVVDGQLPQAAQGQLYLYEADAFSYVEPVESLLQGGPYGGWGQKVGRVPGYPLVYGLLRLMLGQHQALNALVLLQVLALALTTVPLARLVQRLASRWVGWAAWPFVAAFALKCAYLMLQKNAVLIMTEAFAATSLIMLAVALERWTRHPQRTRLLLWVGLWFLAAFSLRPILLPSIGLLVVLVAWVRWRQAPAGTGRWRGVALAVLVVAGPYGVYQLAWSARTWVFYGRPMLIYGSVVYDGQVPADFRTGVSTGLLYVKDRGLKPEFIWWFRAMGLNQNSTRRLDHIPRVAPAMKWFEAPDSLTNPDAYVPGQVAPVPYFDGYYTTAYNYDSLVRLRAYAQWATNPDCTQATRTRALAYVTERSRTYRLSLKAEKPWRYHVGSRLRMLGTFLTFFVHPGWRIVEPLERYGGIFLAYILLNNLAQLLGVGLGVPAALWVLLGPGWGLFERWWAALTLYMVAIFPLGVQIIEFRYLEPVIPLLQGLAVLGVARGAAWLSRGQGRRWGTNRAELPPTEPGGGGKP